jgi:hypothetical protein
MRRNLAAVRASFNRHIDPASNMGEQRQELRASGKLSPNAQMVLKAGALAISRIPCCMPCSR